MNQGTINGVGEEGEALKVAEEEKSKVEEHGVQMEKAGGGAIVGAELKRSRATRSGEEREREGEEEKKRLFGDGVHREKFRSLLGGGGAKKHGREGEGEEEEEEAAKGGEEKNEVVEVKGPAEVREAAKRTLYTANVGDARAVLS